MSVMYNVFLWFYCLPLDQIIILASGATVIFMLFRNICEKKRLWKLLVFAGLILSVMLVLVQTVLNRSQNGVQLMPELVPLHTYRTVLSGGNPEILRMNFMNAILVYPAGLFLNEALPKEWKRWPRTGVTVLLLGALCAGVEYCQYAYSIGQAEIDDVLHNALGALIGALVCNLTIGEK